MNKQCAWAAVKTLGLWAIGGIYLGITTVLFINATRLCITEPKFKFEISDK